MRKNPYRTFDNRSGRKSLIIGLVVSFLLLIAGVLLMEVLNYLINFNPY